MNCSFWILDGLEILQGQSKYSLLFLDAIFMDEVDNRGFLENLLDVMYEELPMPRMKKKK